MNQFTQGDAQTQGRAQAAGFVRGESGGRDAAASAAVRAGGGVRWPWLIGGLLCVVGASAMVALPFVFAQQPEPLDRFGAVPGFELVDRFGEDFDRQQLDGRVWVANFMFTRCPSICPVMSRHMAGLQDELRKRGLRDSAQLVSFSVDPTRDTPEVLRQWGQDRGAEPGFWRLLTGERSEIWTLCRDGFKLMVAENDDPAEPVTHSGKLVLVDQAGIIRGYYDGLTPAVIDELAKDVQRLVDEGA